MTPNTRLVTADTGNGNSKQPPSIVRTPPIKLDTLRHLRDELGRVYREARVGKIATQDATRLAYMLGQLREVVMAMDIESRIAALEALNGEEN